jgi:hypothetical protein
MQACTVQKLHVSYLRRSCEKRHHLPKKVATCAITLCIIIYAAILRFVSVWSSYHYASL